MSIQGIWVGKQFGFEPPSHPKVFGELFTSADDPNGDIKLSRSFMKLDPLVRADILQDVIGLLNREYDKALEAMRNE